MVAKHSQTADPSRSKHHQPWVHSEALRPAPNTVRRVHPVRRYRAVALGPRLALPADALRAVSRMSGACCLLRQPFGPASAAPQLLRCQLDACRSRLSLSGRRLGGCQSRCSNRRRRRGPALARAALLCEGACAAGADSGSRSPVRGQRPAILRGSIRARGALLRVFAGSAGLLPGRCRVRTSGNDPPACPPPRSA